MTLYQKLLALGTATLVSLALVSVMPGHAVAKQHAFNKNGEVGGTVYATVHAWSCNGGLAWEATCHSANDSLVDTDLSGTWMGFTLTNQELISGGWHNITSLSFPQRFTALYRGSGPTGQIRVCNRWYATALTSNVWTGYDWETHVTRSPGVQVRC